MKVKNLQVSTLLDYYGEMLTEKQRDLTELYYNEDLSLGEIAELEHISRQGVRDSIKRGEAYLFELEEKLSVAGKMNEISKAFAQISQMIDEVLSAGGSVNVRQLLEDIKNISDTMQEKI